MIQQVNFSSFCDAFRNMNRDENFSYEGKRLLFDYLEEIDQNYDLDVIALCCDYLEDTEEAIRKYYSLESDASVEDYLSENTSIIGQTKDGSFVYANF